MKKHILVFIFFFIITMIMLYPLSFKMNKAVTEFGDSLLWIWTIQWDIHKLTSNIKNFFDANIFYPNKLTLAYSEHGIGSAILALPIWFITHNPIFLFNFLLIISFILSGFGAYLLAFELTKNRISSIISGIVFSFCPFHFLHIAQLHIYTYQWLPFIFLYLHKFLKNQKFKNGLLISLFLTLQTLTSMHIGVFLSVFIVLFIIYFFRKLNIKKLLTTLLISFLICLPFFLPYIKLKKEKGFIRPIEDAACWGQDIISYFIPHNDNILYSKILNKIDNPIIRMATSTEKNCFLGFIPIILLAIYLLKSGKEKKVIKILYLILFFLLLIFVIFAPTIRNWNLIKRTFITAPIITIFLSIIILSQIGKLTEFELFYLILTIIAVILAFGPIITFTGAQISYTPYILFYKFWPGFSGIRAVSRIAIFLVFGSSILLSYATQEKRNIYKFIIIILILIEYLYKVPINKSHHPLVKPEINKIKQVYRWLSRQEKCAIFELPIGNEPVECPGAFWDVIYVYYSIYHWQNIVNGYSSYHPKNYNYIRRIAHNFPTKEGIDFLKKINVKYILLHESFYEKDVLEKKLKEINDSDDLFFVNKFDDVYVYSIR